MVDKAHIVPLHQKLPDMCYAYSIKMSLESALRHFEITSLDIKIEHLNHMIGYRKGDGVAGDGNFSLLDRFLREKGLQRKLLHAPKSDMALLERLVNSNIFPVITLKLVDVVKYASYKYDDMKIDSDNPWQHVMVAVNSDDTHISICDPLWKYSESKFDFDNAPSTKFKKLQFIRAWDETARFIMWFEPNGKPRTLQKGLEDIDGKI